MLYFLFYLATFAAGAANKEAAFAGKESRTYRTAPAWSDSVILTKGVPETVEGARLTYQGIDDDILIIDVTILALDPQYAYRRTIPRRTAELGFSLNEQQYRLISAGRSRLKISRTGG